MTTTKNRNYRTGLFARPAVTQADRQAVEKIIATTGESLWLDAEVQLDAVTALSGSGPAYMFYFMEAMTEAGAQMGLTRKQAHQLAVATFNGAGELARASPEPPEVLRQRVTPKGGTTFAAITSMEDSQMKELFIKAMHASQVRAAEIGRKFGGRSLSRSQSKIFFILGENALPIPAKRVALLTVRLAIVGLD